MSLSNEDLLAISQLLDTQLDKQKHDILNHVDSKLDSLETSVLNTCLSYTDEREEIVNKKLDVIQSTLNTIKTDNSTVNLLLKSVSDLQNEVAILKSRLDKVS